MLKIPPIIAITMSNLLDVAISIYIFREGYTTALGQWSLRSFSWVKDCFYDVAVQQSNGDTILVHKFGSIHKIVTMGFEDLPRPESIYGFKGIPYF